MANSYPRTPPSSRRFITAVIADVSTAGQIYVSPGFRGKIIKASSALNGAITGTNSILTLKIGGTAVTGGSMTVTQSGSAAGDVDTCLPTALATFATDQAIEIETDGGSTGAVAVMITLEVEPV